MRRLPRHLTVRVDRQTAEDFHAQMARRGSTASAYLREAIRAAVAASVATAPAKAPCRAG